MEEQWEAAVIEGVCASRSAIADASNHSRQRSQSRFRWFPEQKGILMARRKYKCKLSAAVKAKAKANWRSEQKAAGVSTKIPKRCKLVVFGKPGCRSGKATLRCEGKKLSTSAKKRYRRMVRTGEICRKGKRVRFKKAGKSWRIDAFTSRRC